ncbi:hypothetical protein MU1_11050 [Paenibacillus glycanilyticus]|uniref:Uncharacterized protein n=2 Tax=Paenibacillus glycanilyticus TaxID=126569 RepID=A0ABQ6GBS3_9BACL|nr:hypothetical protein MU1_11050 [Paenibacillus glycanilyticus]
MLMEKRNFRFIYLAGALILIVVIAAGFLTFNHSKKTQVISNPSKMQMCNDTGIFDNLSPAETKAWGFGVHTNMMFAGSVVCIYNGFGKPAVNHIIFSKDKKEAQIYVQTDAQMKNYNRVEVILPTVSTIEVIDAVSKDSYLLYPDAFRN